MTDQTVNNFDMLQTGHGDMGAARGAIPKLIAAYRRTLPMPAMIGEFCYQGHMQAAYDDAQRYVFWGRSLPLVEAAFEWARVARPSQPVTTTLFGDARMRQRVIELSDVLCFHNYGPLPGVKTEAGGLLAHGRPVFCTEWMARSTGSRFETHLPFFKENKLACWSWGLVAGRTQTYFPWGSPRGAAEPRQWHHDILRGDGTPFNARETQFIKVATGKLPPSALPQRTILMQTAEESPVRWPYTLEKPVGKWFGPGFDDTTWRQGAAPFGREESPIARRPNTIWTSADIWLPREFTIPPQALARPARLGQRPAMARSAGRRP